MNERAIRGGGGSRELHDESGRSPARPLDWRLRGDPTRTRIAAFVHPLAPDATRGRRHKATRVLTAENAMRQRPLQKSAGRSSFPRGTGTIRSPCRLKHIQLGSWWQGRSGGTATLALKLDERA